MIICHCNRITNNDIEDAVHCLKAANCSNKSLCPRSVYEELDVCPQCCNCFPLAEKAIAQAEISFIDIQEIRSTGAAEQIPERRARR